MTMQQEEQILGYFIEEAKEQLNIIEQGLLNLETNVKNAEMMNEIFRAAHSIKGSASMLGLSSIQHTSHCLEDWFKILQEHSVQIDVNLESLLLDICDKLKIMIDNLSYPIDLSEQESEVFISKWLEEHRQKLESLIAVYDHDTFADLSTAISADITNQIIPDHKHDFTDLLLLWEDEDNLELADMIGSEKIDHLFDHLAEVSKDNNWNLSLLAEENELAISPSLEVISSALEGDSLLTGTEASLSNEIQEVEGFLAATAIENVNQVVIENEDIVELEALLNGNEDDLLLINSQPIVIGESAIAESEDLFSSWKSEDDFSQWEELLTQSDLSLNSQEQTLQDQTKLPKTSTNKVRGDRSRGTIAELETIKVPVKQLNDISNLVGELVVNRNTLEQDRERLKQYVDTLLAQVQHLSEAGVKMQEYYEGSLLKASLLSSRRLREYKINQNASYRLGENVDYPTLPPDHGFSEIEMDQFTPFHVLAQEMIEFIVRVRESASDIEFVNEKIERVTRQLGQATSRLQEKLTKSRMVPFSQVIDRLRRGVRDNAIKYGKQVELVTEGVHTLIDKMILDHLTYPLTHILNNAIAHGIETPQVRQAAGKSTTGIISIRALQQVNQTIISVSDDGVGIDHQEVKNKAIKKGIITFKQARTMSRFDIYKLLFLPCFSTADEVNDIKGRGVGLNVVENDINHIRGRVTTDSTPGIGTTFTIFLPQTLSICRALLCTCDRFKIAFPMDGVEDTLSISAHSQIIQQDLHQELFMIWRGVKLPIKPLKDILVFNRQYHSGQALVTKQNNEFSVIVVRSGNTMFGLQIDEVLGEQEIVIKQ
ncbi:MAG: chemotaxis protein CheA, partial [Dolichospermum sp.]